MAKLTTRRRKSLRRSDFALPAKRGKNGKNKAGRGAFPLTDKSHDEAAIRDAPHSYHAGNISRRQEKTVIRKAKAKLKAPARRARNRRR